MTGQELIELARLERRHARVLGEGQRKRATLSRHILIDLGALLGVSLAVFAAAVIAMIALH